jgi:murein DD-endopeptidase MepM/ murein hydrolase activator NlpD
MNAEAAAVAVTAKGCIAPHMQYKAFRSIYDKVSQPFESFGREGVSHVGEDSGWLWAGLPVHAIMDGRVVHIQHEESWGCLVCVESVLENGVRVCSYYGHLSSNLDARLGQIVRMGDKIGEIGPAFTFQNGGYRSHLHLGIEKASIEDALIAGYHDNRDRWYDPVLFIRNGGPMPDGSDEF